MKISKKELLKRLSFVFGGIVLLLGLLLANHQQVEHYGKRSVAATSYEGSLISSCSLAAREGRDLKDLFGQLESFYNSQDMDHPIRAVPLTSLKLLCKQAYHCGESESDECVEALFDAVQNSMNALVVEEE